MRFKKIVVALIYFLLIFPIISHCAITTSANRVVYVGTGTVGPFPFPYKFDVNTSLKVTRTNSANPLTLNVDYTVTGAGLETGGYVTLTVALTIAQKLVIERNMDFLQSSPFIAHQAFPALTANTLFEKLAMELQQLRDQSLRSPKLPPEITSIPDLALPVPAAAKLIGWNSAANGLTNYSTTPVYSASFDSIGNYDDNMSRAVRETGTNDHTVLIDKLITVSENVTSPITLTPMILQGGGFTVDSGKILTINQTPDAGNYQIFYGSGTVVFGNAVTPVRTAWFGNDLTLTYDSVTSKSQILVTANATVSKTLVMTYVKNSSIECPTPFSHTIAPGVTFSGGDLIRIGIDDNDNSTVWYPTIKNCFLRGDIDFSGTPVATNAIEVLTAWSGLFKSLHISQFLNDGISFNASIIRSNPPIINANVIDDVWCSNTGGKCYAFYGTGNVNAQIPFSIINSSCWYSSSDCVYVYADPDVAISPTINIYKFGMQNPGRYGINVDGRSQIHIDGDFAEGSQTYSIRAVNKADVYVNNIVLSSMPYADNNSLLKICNSQVNFTRYADQSCYITGRKTSGVLEDFGIWGPPNQPVTKSTFNKIFNSGTEILDPFGVEWYCSTCSDNATLAGANSQWRTKYSQPIIVPFSYSDLTTGTYIAWYPQEAFRIDRIELWTNFDWTSTSGADYISVGTVGDTQGWISSAQGIIANLQLAGTYPISSTGNLYSGAYIPGFGSKFVNGMWNCWHFGDHGTYPDYANCETVTLYRSGTFTAGTGFLVIHGVYTGSIPGGSRGVY